MAGPDSAKGEAQGFLCATASGVRLRVRVVPRASKSGIGELHGDRLKVRIAAPPVESAANDELVAFVAKRLGVPRRAVRLTHGQASRNKTLAIDGVSATDAAARLLVS